MEIIKQFVETTFEEISTDEWLSRINHVKKVEEDYIRLEPQIYEMTEHTVISLQDDSDSDSSMSESGSDDDNARRSNSLTIVTVASFVVRRRGGSQPSPLLTASLTPYHTTPLSRFSGPVWNLSMYIFSHFLELDL
ncbi:hypothetical protein J6590_101825 [Homalodisca vitripennis]|nr:hypothetical protein J6590_101825 [Homalodisca vitripennis]